jgi:ketosteroid isomerase-like protein
LNLGAILILIRVTCVRRSSLIILAAALFLLVSVVVMTLLYRDVTAPVMTSTEAETFLKRGVNALERGDVDAVMELFTADASIFKRRPDQLRRALARSLNEIESSRFRVTWKDLSVIQRGQEAVIQVTISLGEQSNEMHSTYYNDIKLRATLEKVRSSELFGMYTLEQWKITNLTSDVEIEILEY